MCVKPITLNDGRVVPCGHCYSCQSARRSEWAARNAVEAYNSARSYFVTLTFDDDQISILPFHSETGLYLFDKSVYQRFLKRFRKDFNFRYYLVHEYGTHTLRPHYHIIFYFQDDVNLDSFTLSRYWPYGLITCDPLTPARIHYVTKYLNKSFRRYYGNEEYWRYMYDSDDSRLRSVLTNFVLYYNTVNRMSTRPAIGYQLLYDTEMIDYIRSYADAHDSYPSFFFQGQSFRLPRYYIDRIFSDDERDAIYALSQVTSTVRDTEDAVRNSLSVSDLHASRQRKDELMLESYASKCCVSDIL